jgi:hypothetical protein
MHRKTSRSSILTNLTERVAHGKPINMQKTSSNVKNNNLVSNGVIQNIQLGADKKQ